MNNELNLLSAKIIANSRIDLYGKNYLFGIKWAFPALLLASSIALSSLFSADTINQTQLIISSAIVIIVLLALQVLLRRARVAALKGDVIILKGIDSKSTITPIQSIRRASSYQILGIHITLVDYILDHQKKTSFVLGTPSDINYRVDKVIAFAKKCRKK